METPQIWWKLLVLIISYDELITDWVMIITYYNLMIISDNTNFTVFPLTISVPNGNLGMKGLKDLQFFYLKYPIYRVYRVMHFTSIDYRGHFHDWNTNIISLVEQKFCVRTMGFPTCKLGGGRQPPKFLKDNFQWSQPPQILGCS